MFRLIKQVFSAWLSSIRSLATKYVSLNNEPCMIWPTLINVNLIEVDYYPFMISPDTYDRSCDVVGFSSTKTYVPRETKGVMFNYLMW